ncbi:hypothetical protein C3L33_11593, partial [Rhododendron williamsianum]
MIQWVQRLRIAFGTSFLWLVCLIYFTQIQSGPDFLSASLSPSESSAAPPSLLAAIAKSKWRFCSKFGFRSFVWTAVSYQLKDGLKLSPSASQLVSSIAFFPWSIKPLYGYASDFFSIETALFAEFLFKKRVP